ncbi:MAG: LD-carboxypeptidase [Burkholderiales bacterium]|nr:LD-carboxypeptidase [Burkholderiales bacterium]
MSIRFPTPLAPGDLIAITAPSSGVPVTMHPKLDLALDALRNRGYRVIEGECLRKQVKSASGPRQQRAAELMKFLIDPNVAAVMPPWGGELAIELLDLLNFEELATAVPKWFSGFSDLSTLQLPLLSCSGWATLHGPNLMQLATEELDRTTNAIWEVLAASHKQPFTQHASAEFVYANTETAQPSRQTTRWKRLDGSNAPLGLKGRLIGGCIDSISRLAGTRYGNVSSFVQSVSHDGAILYLENAELRPCELARALWGLRLNGWFSGLRGVLLGRSAASDTHSPSEFSHVDALRSALDDIRCPVLFDLDIGHVPPQLSLMNGALAEVTFSNGGGSITQRLGV